MTLNTDSSETRQVSENPDSLFHSHAAVARVKQRLADGDRELLPALERLRAEADEALLQEPVSVTTKQVVPPSGQANDYQSLAPYWWPDPQRNDGLPYIRRDGVLNPQARDPRYSDRAAIETLVDTVETLGWAFFFLEDPRYAEHTALMLRTFFVDEETRMNPHLRYAQAIRGREDGRFIGVIDTRRLPFLLDAATTIRATPFWNEADHDALTAWFSEYTDWLVTHEFGRRAASHYNNHGTWYDLQVAAYATFLGRDDLRRLALERARQRIGRHFDGQGRQEHELARTRSFNYSVMNLYAFMLLARLGEQAGVDLWNHRGDDGRSLQAGIDFLLPYADREAEWKWEQIVPLNRGSLAPLLRLAALAYNEKRYEDALEQLGREDMTCRSRLLWPLPVD